MKQISVILIFSYFLGNYILFAKELSSGEKTEMVNAHNRVRGAHGVPSLKWSTKAENFAIKWAKVLKGNGCKMKHSSHSDRGNGALGENLFWQGALSWSDGRKELVAVTPDKVVQSWADEEKDYNYKSNSCRSVCGHYTQVVWKATTGVGCAMEVCSDKTQVWICNYEPAGNYIGQKPY